MSKVFEKNQAFKPKVHVIRIVASSSPAGKPEQDQMPISEQILAFPERFDIQVNGKLVNYLFLLNNNKYDASTSSPFNVKPYQKSKFYVPEELKVKLTKKKSSRENSISSLKRRNSENIKTAAKEARSHSTAISAEESTPQLQLSHSKVSQEAFSTGKAALSEYLITSPQKKDSAKRKFKARSGFSPLKQSLKLSSKSQRNILELSQAPSSKNSDGSDSIEIEKFEVLSRSPISGALHSAPLKTVSTKEIYISSNLSDLEISNDISKNQEKNSKEQIEKSVEKSRRATFMRTNTEFFCSMKNQVPFENPTANSVPEDRENKGPLIDFSMKRESETKKPNSNKPSYKEALKKLQNVVKKLPQTGVASKKPKALFERPKPLSSQTSTLNCLSPKPLKKAPCRRASRLSSPLRTLNLQGPQKDTQKPFFQTSTSQVDPNIRTGSPQVKFGSMRDLVKMQSGCNITSSSLQKTPHKTLSSLLAASPKANNDLKLNFRYL